MGSVKIGSYEVRMMSPVAPFQGLSPFSFLFCFQISQWNTQVNHHKAHMTARMQLRVHARRILGPLLPPVFVSEEAKLARSLTAILKLPDNALRGLGDDVLAALRTRSENWFCSSGS